MPNINDLKLAKELIRFPSITPNDCGIIKFLERKLKLLGFKTQVLEFKDKKSQPVKNIYARLGKKKPNFCYADHVLNDFNDEEKIELNTITKSITESLPILLDKKLDLFSSTVNNK